MKVLFVIFLFVISLAYGAFAQQECDYKVEIITNGNEFNEENLKFRVKATRLEGEPSNITGKAEITDSSGKRIKSYNLWGSDLITRQKTSNDYSPNLNKGEYTITSKINVGCHDINKENNIDFKKIKINGNETKRWEISNFKKINLTSNGEIENMIEQRHKAVYDSSKEQLKEATIFLILALSILLNIVLIWRR